ncbi:hypothetical protein TNCV_3379421 [Trichonephila clavipes]|nr:hypothetical protein TNCV_3379421 [Trichonephila clavipes]
MGRRMHLPGNVDNLARQLEQICQEIPQKTIRLPFHFVPRHVAACIRARGHVIRMDEGHLAENVFNSQTFFTRRTDCPNLRWIYGLENDLLVLKTKNWRAIPGRSLTCERLLEKPKTHPELLNH